MTVPVAVQLERDLALYDIWYETEWYGDDITFYIRNENDVVRDEYNSIKTFEATTPTTNTIKMKAFPVIENPSQRQMEQAGLRELSGCIVYTPAKSWSDILTGKTIQQIFELIDITRVTVSLRGNEYNIKDKTLHSVFADTFAYINFSLNQI